ncbi:MAG TPA: S8/S53 family peptidase, partial [Acidimicrobiales bacterium]|nr:S8/S53 family peptidase [Acidimicrobiales bacterium]
RGRVRHEGPWADRVRFDHVSGDAPFAYRPDEVVTTGGDEALAVVSGLYPGAQVRGELDSFLHLVDVPEPVELVHELRIHGHVAHPNHVFFAHDTCGCCPPHPSSPCGVTGAPMYGHAAMSGAPMYGHAVMSGAPMYGHAAVYGSPMYGHPMYGHPMYGHAPLTSTARPAAADAPVGALSHEFETPRELGGPTVIVLDTGLAESPFTPAALDVTTSIRMASPSDGDRPDENGDHLLDPAAGHGTFIAGVVDQIAPGCDITVHRVLSTFGDGDEVGIVHCLNDLVIDDPFHTIVNLSFGGYVLDHPFALARAVRHLQARGVVVVASAGNDATCLPTFPAALPGVVGVGAVGPAGPAPFSNYGPWVRACAPGVDLLSCFFEDFDGMGGAGADGVDPDRFRGWAVWSGTSFAAPVVVGALARVMRERGCTAREAVTQVVDAPALMRIPNLGTVVNVI